MGAALAARQVQRAAGKYILNGEQANEAHCSLAVTPTGGREAQAVCPAGPSGKPETPSPPKRACKVRAVCQGQEDKTNLCVQVRTQEWRPRTR